MNSRPIRSSFARRRLLRLVAVGVAGAFLLCGCSRKADLEPDPATPVAIWQAIQPQAARYRMEPGFIFALVAAESNFNPDARTGEARGLLQLTPAAWREVRRTPYETEVRDWRKNLAAGVDYLAWCRSYLHRKQKFSYPLLLAVFHYGIDYVEQRDFDRERIGPPENEVYRALWRGNLAPLPPPNSQIPR